jgi:hypothetical protein
LDKTCIGRKETGGAPYELDTGYRIFVSQKNIGRHHWQRYYSMGWGKGSLSRGPPIAMPMYKRDSLLILLLFSYRGMEMEVQENVQLNMIAV